MKEIINGLVSEQVMGWRRKTVPNNENELPYYANFWINELGEKMKPVNFWSPASDLKDAWVVLCKLREQGILISIKTYIDKFESTYDGEFGALSELETLAICIASLKTVGVAISDEYAYKY